MKLQKFRGEQTQMIDCGRWARRARADRFAHPSYRRRAAVGLGAIAGREVARRVCAAHRRIRQKASKPGTWITGGDWDHTLWGGELPTRDWIDAVTPDNPVWINRLDGHMSLANSAALRAAKVADDVKDVPGGEIVRDKNGRPTGVFKDNAMSTHRSRAARSDDATATRCDVGGDGLFRGPRRNGGASSWHVAAVGSFSRRRAARPDEDADLCVHAARRSGSGSRKK